MSPDRIATLEAAWLTPGGMFFGSIRCRPFSLGSILLSRALSIPLGHISPSLEARMDAAGRLVWSHSQPLDSVLWALHRGQWEDALLAWELEHDAAEWLGEVEAHLLALGPVVAAATVDIRRRPSRAGEEDRDPADVVEPHWLAAYVATISGVVSRDPHEIVWHTPLAIALQWYHASLRANGVWTVSPGVTGEHTREDAAELEELAALAAAERRPAAAAEDPLALLAAFDAA